MTTQAPCLTVWAGRFCCPLQVLEVVRKYNADPSVNGILVQLPLPAGMDEERVLGAISIEKDVDGATDAAPLSRPSPLCVASFPRLGTRRDCSGAAE